MDSVSYYDSQVEYQRRVGEMLEAIETNIWLHYLDPVIFREKERFKLEREMFSMMKSDEKLQNLRAAKLQSYWNQICEREKGARERNDELLEDFKQLEVKLAGMEKQTKKLKSMKVT